MPYSGGKVKPYGNTTKKPKPKKPKGMGGKKKKCSCGH